MALPLEQNPQARICVSGSGWSQGQLFPAVERELCPLFWVFPGKRGLGNLCSATPTPASHSTTAPLSGTWRQKLLEPHCGSLHVFMPQIFIDNLLTVCGAHCQVLGYTSRGESSQFSKAD